MNEALEKLAEKIQQASPIVWQAAYRQVWIDGVENVVFVLVFAILARAMWLWRKKVLAKDDDVMEPGPVLLAIGSVGSILLTLPFAIDAINCFVNPTLAAIKELRGIV